MNIQTLIPYELWSAIKINYERKNFSGAILDSFYLLSEIIREKSGIEGDGSSLIGAAFGGVNPKIKLNRLESESEINFQKGIEQTLRGLYQSIRNPRSHEKIDDSEDDTIGIILFIGFLIKNISNAKSQFSIEEFLERVKDIDYVHNEKYSNLLTEEIPKKHVFNVFLEVYRYKDQIDINNLSFFLKSLLKKLNESDREKIIEIVSKELSITNDETSISKILESVGHELWEAIDEISKIRIENKLLKSIDSGIYDINKNSCIKGHLGTWISSVIEKFSSKEKLQSAIAKKLRSKDNKERFYALKFIIPYLSQIYKEIPGYIDYSLRICLEFGDEFTYNQIEALSFEIKISDQLKQALEDFEPVKNKMKSFDDMSDDIPF